MINHKINNNNNNNIYKIIHEIKINKIILKLHYNFSKFLIQV